MVRVGRFERPVSCSQGRRINQTFLHTDGAHERTRTSILRFRRTALILLSYVSNWCGRRATIPRFPLERRVAWPI